MKRRTFLRNSIIASAGFAGYSKSSLAQTPCPPSLTGDDSDPVISNCGEIYDSLSEAAAALLPGESIQFTKNPHQRENDIQWSLRTIFYDANRGELQYMGKPASGQSLDYSHYIYREDSDSWIATGTSLFPGSGHIWDCTFDPDNGDYWFHKLGENILRWFDRSDGANGKWKETSEQYSPRLSAGDPSFAAMGWHPNLYGPDRPGLLIWSAMRFFAYNPLDDIFRILNPSNFDSESVYYLRRPGQAIYCPETDQLLCFAGDFGNGHPAIAIEAGAGNSSDLFRDSLVSTKSEPPIIIVGQGGPVNHGHVVPHPDDPNKMFILDEQTGESSVWLSANQGDSWGLQSYLHPFQAMRSWTGGEYTVGTIQKYGIVIGMASNSSGGEVVLWRPPAL